MGENKTTHITIGGHFVGHESCVACVNAGGMSG